MMRVQLGLATGLEVLTCAAQEDLSSAWPRPSLTAVVNITECHPMDLKSAGHDCGQCFLPLTELPESHCGWTVRATVQEWHKIAKAGYDRGLMVAVVDQVVPWTTKAALSSTGTEQSWS